MWISSGSQVAAMPIACGKTVANPARATPCRASLHQSYSVIPNRWMAGAWFCICPIFSFSVIRETRSLTRALSGSAGSRNGSAVWPKESPGIRQRRETVRNKSVLRELIITSMGKTTGVLIMLLSSADASPGTTIVTSRSHVFRPG